MKNCKLIIIPALLCIFIHPVLLFAQNNTISLTHDERNWLARKHTVRVRVGNWPPFMFSEDGFKGISVDYIKKIFSLHNIDYQFISEKEVPWKDALENIGKHQVIDLILTAKITDERKKFMIFTDEYLFLPWVIFSRTDSFFIGGIDDLAGKTVCVPEGYVMHELLKNNYPEINLSLISGDNRLNRCMESLALGEVDAYIGNLAVGTFIIQNKGYNDLKIAAPTPFGTHNQAMAVRDDWPELASIINKTLKSFTPQEHSEIRNRWLSVRYEYGIQPKDILKWVLSISSILISILLIILFWNRKLNREILERQRVEQNLRESESKYQCLSDASFEGILLVKDNVIIDANQTMANMFGYESTASLIGKPSTDFVSPEDRKKMQNKIMENNDKPYELKGIKKDGTIFPVEVHGKLFSFKGNMIRVTAIRDLSEKKKAEDEIKQLQGILPICMHCKGIRDDQGYWNQLEKYISEHSDVKFSHGICDKCLDKYYPELKPVVQRAIEESR